ncbi:MAG: HAMP domain-containing protein [Leptospira sp.]|nr:HAMP domain-containing protein [Leptospira sp.]
MNLVTERTEGFPLFIKNLATELQTLLNGGNLLIQYPSEEEGNLQDILTLFAISLKPSEDLTDIPLASRPFGRPLEDWKKEFLELGFQFFKERISNPNKSIQLKDTYKTAVPPQEIKQQAPSKPVIKSEPEVKTQTKIEPPPKVISNPKEALSPNETISKPVEVSKPVQTKVEEQKETSSEAIKSEEEKHSVSVSDKPVKTKFSIQLKMMGIISLILAVTVSTIIGLATYFFKDTSEKTVQVNSLAIVELVGLKVSSDIQSIVIKGEQLVTTMIRSNQSDADRKFISDLFFTNDKDFIYVGLYHEEDNNLIAEKNYFNTNNLIESNLSEDEILANVQRNSEALIKTFTGKPNIINSTPGFTQGSFLLAVPANLESDKSKILIIMVKLEKILSAFDKNPMTTTFMVNDDGIAIAHPIEEVIISATSFLDLPIVKAMLTSQVDTGQLRYISKNGAPYLGSYRKIGFGDAGIISIVSEDKAFEEVYNIQARNLYIMGISLCLALIIVFFFAKSITRPILSLLNATLEIAKGNFRVGIASTTQDEVGLLTDYFKTMGEGLEEREKVKSILGSMIDPVVVKEAMIDMAALKRGKEAEITSFFSDVASFSTISEQLTSVDLASLLNEYLSAMTIILKENEGVLDKYIGDAIVGIFGAPVEVEQHAVKACKASLEMVYKLEDLRQYWQKNNLYSKEAQIMDARIGLNTGPAKVGFMGTDALASYTMMGDTVNLAARLEAAGKDYGVNVMIAENTNNLVQDHVYTRILDLVRVKGKNEPVKVFELVAFRNDIKSNIADAIGYYEEGFNLYLEQDWVRAIQKFEACLQAKFGKDKSSKMLIDRCKEYKTNSPGNDWDGVFTRTTK